MLICHCHGVTHREIQEAVADGAQTLEEVGDRCGAGRGCGGCLEAVCEIMADALVDADSLTEPRPPVVPLPASAA